MIAVEEKDIARQKRGKHIDLISDNATDKVNFLKSKKNNCDVILVHIINSNFEKF